jgi:transposase
MERTPKGIYTPGFRAEAVKLVERTGMPVGRAAKHLSMPKSGLDNWVRAAREGKRAEVGNGQRLPSELELARTRKALTEARMERDPLKEFATYFAKESRRNMPRSKSPWDGRIDELRLTYPVAGICRILGISESGYHAWPKRPPSR